jgi:outer membrane receptor for ferrienterochelin and colicins
VFPGVFNWKISGYSLPQFDVKVAYNYLEVYRKVEGIRQDLPFVPTHKWSANTSYSIPNDQWQFDLTYRWTGSKRLPSTAGYPDQYKQPDVSASYQQTGHTGYT